MPSLFFLTPHERTVGNTAEEIHFGLMYARMAKKKVVFLRRFSFRNLPPISNRELFEVESPQTLHGFFRKAIGGVGNFILTVFLGHLLATWTYFWVNAIKITAYVLRRKFHEPLPYLHFRHCFRYLNFGNEQIWNPQDLSLDAAIQFNWKKELETPLALQFDSRKTAAAEKNLRALGLGENDWFVCLHNREGTYHQDLGDQRNSSIQNYFKAVKAIVAAGGWVIRMGDSKMTPLPKMERVIDYPFTPLKSEFMDLYLLKNCRFFLGQNSGIMDIAYLFGKRCVLANVTEWAISFPRLRNSLVIFKHLYSAEKKRTLSTQEFFDQPFHALDLHQFRGENRFIENTEEEICSLVMEALQHGPNCQYSALQEQVILYRAKRLESLLTSGELYPGNPDADRIYRFRLASRCTGLEGTLGRKFLEDNWVPRAHIERKGAVLSS